MKKIQSGVKILSEAEIELIHKSSLKILADVGIKLPNRECLSLCQEHGAKVDFEKEIMWLPAPLIEETLEQLRVKQGEQPDREEPQRIRGHISTQIQLVDYGTKTRRNGVMDDNLKGFVLIDQLENISGSSPVVIPSDVPANMTDLLSYQMMFTYAKRPGGTYILSPTSAKYIIEMGRVMGRKEGYLLATVSPLQFRKESLDIAMEFVRQGMPLATGPMVIGGASGPITVAGTVTVQNAEMLASIFVIYLLTGQFSNFNAGSHTMDPKTMLCSFGSPNQALIGMATAQMAHYYGYKRGAWTNSGLTDALLPDFQCAFDKTSTVIYSMLAGNDSNICVGIVGADQGISLEQLILDNEWIGAYNYIQKGIEVNEETIALELIERLGIGGNFIAEEHTVKHMRTSYWMSRLFNRDSWNGWEAHNSPDAFQRAHTYLEEILRKNYPPEPVLEPGKLDQINYITRSAVDELQKEN